ncbi:MAG: GAF domain-containing protein, partial [Proteobacteria bacterium]|nr:GAF domain-containing protein [Pseudomonadota bacterium]
MLGDAAKEGNFTNDSYIHSKKPKSVLGMPILHQGKLTGVLYLENRLAMHVFTKNRLELLQILASQAAIALENAISFEKLNKERNYTASIINNSSSLICGIDSYGATIFANPAALE